MRNIENVEGIARITSEEFYFRKNFRKRKEKVYLAYLDISLIRGSNETELTVAKANLSPRNVGHHQTDEVVGNTRWKMANVNRKAKISFAEAH